MAHRSKAGTISAGNQTTTCPRFLRQGGKEIEMTNDDKRELKRILRVEPERSNEDIQRQIGCSLATVKKYRRIFGTPLKAEPSQ